MNTESISIPQCKRCKVDMFPTMQPRLFGLDRMSSSEYMWKCSICGGTEERKETEKEVWW